jgi:hypothetical protein
MKTFLKLSYMWLILTEDGLLKTPRDKWGETHPLSKKYRSRSEAIEDYSRFTNNGLDSPYEMVLVEHHSKEYNWEE